MRIPDGQSEIRSHGRKNMQKTDQSSVVGTPNIIILNTGSVTDILLHGLDYSLCKIPVPQLHVHIQIFVSLRAILF